jgi:hypothetical protein
MHSYPPQLYGSFSQPKQNLTMIRCFTCDQLSHMKNVYLNHQQVKERVSPPSQNLVGTIDTNCVTMQPTLLKEDCPN